QKLAVLNGERPRGLTPEDVEAVHREGREEGMTGIDPRYVVNRLASAVIRRDAPCITAVDVLRALRDGPTQHGMWTRASRSDLEQWVSLARQRYDREIRERVERAYLEGQDENARALFHVYLDQIEISLWPNRRLDPITGQRLEPDEELMRAIEDGLGITDVQRRSFREEVWMRVSTAGRREAWDHRIHPELQQAVEDRLFMDLRDLVKMHAAEPPDLEAEVKIRTIADRLAGAGFCPYCAREAVLYVGTLLAR
ncbi:MAG: protein prkA, partial [Clostridia bacterium]